MREIPVNFRRFGIYPNTWRLASLGWVRSGLLSLGIFGVSAASGQDLVWESQGLVDEDAITSGSTFSYNGATVTVTWSTATDGGSFVYYPDASGGPGNGSVGGGNDFVSFEGSQEGAHTGLLLMGFNNGNYDPDDYITMTLTFSSAQTGLAFSLLDIDADSWDDGVLVTYNGGTNVRANTALWEYGQSSSSLQTVVTDDEGSYTGWEGAPQGGSPAFGKRANPDQNYGNIDLDFTGVSVSSVQIRFFSTDDGGGNNPGGQKIGISDLYRTFVPEPGTGLAAALLALLGVWRFFGREERALPSGSPKIFPR
jgi:hypothetical protein